MGGLQIQPESDLIFQPFQRLSDRTSHDGSGLGLPIVASIAVTVAIPSAGAPAPLESERRL